MAHYLRLIGPVVLVLALVGCADPGSTDSTDSDTPEQPRFSAEAASLRLSDGMTMQEVENTIGYRPSSASQMTCGGANGDPWPCRIWTFGGSLNTLTVRFENDDGVWKVNSWGAY